MLNKSVLSLVLSFSMLISPLPNGGGTNIVSSGGLSALGTGSSVIQTDETVTQGDAQTDASSQEENLISAQADDASQTAQNVISEDFESESGNWGMTGSLADSLSIAAETSGNKYLHLYVEKGSTKSAVKSLGDNIPRLATATVSFDWYVGNLTTDNRGGYGGLLFKNGDTEVFSLYHKDTRGAGTEKPVLQYSANGFDAKQASSFKLDNIIAADKNNYAVEIVFDFSAHKATLKVDGTVVAEDVAISAMASKIDQFELLGAGSVGTGKTFTWEMGIDDFSFAYEEPQAKKGSIVYDFENEESADWGMTGNLKEKGTVEIQAGGTSGKRLYINVAKASTASAVKTFGDVSNLSEAVISFDWYVGNLTTDNRGGYGGLLLKNGDTEVFSLYHKDTRGAGTEKPALQYSGNGFDAKEASSFKLDNIIDNADKSSYAVEMAFDFSAHKATLKVDGTVVAENVAISAGASKIDRFELLGAGSVGTGKTFAWQMAIDNFRMDYTESLEEIAPSIFELASLPKVGLSQAEYQAGYTHPATVEATLLTGDKIEVPIKADSWTSAPAFDADKEGIYTWEAEIDPPAENENVNNLKASYQMSYKVLRKVSEADGTVVINTDFEDESDAKWGMAGTGVGNLSVVDDAVWNGNKLLKFATTNLNDSTTTTKSFENLPKMITAKIEFEWNVGEMSSNSRYGWRGITLMSGDNELFSLWLNDVRGGETKSLYYSVKGFEKKEETGKTVTNGTAYDVEITIDFSEHKLTMKLDGQEAVSADILEIAKKVDGLSIATVVTGPDANKINSTMTIDDFFFAYVEDTSVSEDKVTIYSLDPLPNAIVKQEDWEAGTYKHPATVSAMLSNGEKIDVEIAADSWKCDSFDAGKKASYTWTADIVAPEQYENTKGLKASYVMEYHAVAAADHDYYYDFTFASEVWESTAWGKSLDDTSGSGYLTLSQKKEENGNGYLFASVSNAGGSRGTRKDFSTDAVKGAVLSFDWMPVTAAPAGVGSGNVDFFSAMNNQNYFTLRFDSDYKISYFTKGDYNNTAVQPEFTGSISEDDRVDTGLSGRNKWFTVKLTFDYYAHTAKLEIAERDDPNKNYTATVPIEGSANGLSTMVLRLDRTQNDKSGAEMGLDNVALDYVPFDADWIVGVKNPADVNVAKSQWDEFAFPETVEVTLGDNSKTEVPVGQWTAEPAHDLETSEAGEYVWTAPLVPGSLKNEFGFTASFTMTYTKLPFPVFVYNPNTLELPFGEALPAELPKEVDAKMSDGTMSKVAVGDWTPILGFDAEKEGIYVYGASVIPVDGKYQVVDGKITPNENPADPSAWHKDIAYDVYYRVSYFKSSDNYNAYQRSMEYLDRGVYAVEKDGGVFVSWRLLVTEYGDENIAFNVYRNGVLANKTPITTKTNFVDAAGKAGDVYTVAKLAGDRMYESKEVTASAKNYLSIPLQKPDPQPDINGDLSAYTINDAGVADVDGDGEYEIIVKWYPNDAFDSSGGTPSSPTIFDIYKMDGTPLWRLNLGLEMPSGAHFNQFMLYDLDEDGKAELFIKTSDGSISYKPNAEGRFDMSDESTIVSYIGDRSVKPGTNIVSAASGHVNGNSNEYVTVFNGLTGEEISTINYVNTTGDFTDWGTSGGKNDGGNRSARYNIAIAYLPKDKADPNCTETIPAVLFNRGYYEKTTIAAYTLRDGKLNLEWNFVRQNGENEASKGNHNVSTGDIDKDGFDEIVIGALAIDHDGSVLWVKDGKDGQDFAGHADAIHLAAMNPENNDLYVFVPAEEKDSTVNHSLSNAATGARLNGAYFTRKDVGRAVAANITPNPGYEYWSAAGAGGITSGIYGFDGSIISNTKPVSMNWRMYWDGDLLSELGDGIATDDDWAITKYDWVNNKVDTLATLEGTKTNNSTKKTPSLTADIFGDWREEVVLRNDDDTEIRIYMTTDETDYMIYTLMHDPVYRNAVANQNTAYNQPPHIGFYLGADNADDVLAMGLPTANVKYTVEVNEESKPIPAEPTTEPSAEPTTEPSAEPTTEPSAEPTTEPSAEPTIQPTVTPAAQPTAAPADDGDDDDEDDEPAAAQEPVKAPAAATPRPANQRPQTTPRPVATNAPTAQPTATPKPTATAAPKPETTAAPTAKPGSNEHTLTFDFGKADEIPAEELTEDVKKNTGCETVQQLMSYMKSELIRQFNGSISQSQSAPVYVEANTVVVNVAVLVDGVPATKENFPKEGVDVVIPYPQGTNKINFNFVVGHMPSNDWNGAKPGVMEYLTPVKTDEGLKVHVLSASPFVVSWTELANPAQSDNVTAGGNFTIWIIVGVLAAALVGIGVVVFVRQKKKNGEE